MRRVLPILLLLWLTATNAAAQGDPHSLQLMGIAVEGPIDSVRQRLTAAEFAEWGQSDDGEDYYFRGKYYGIRAKLLVSVDPKTQMVTSAYVTIGPYSTEKMLTRNQQYFLYKLQHDHGPLKQHADAWVYMDEYGSIKLTVVDNGNGSSDIRVLYYPEAAYYKDAISIGLHGPVQEVVTENAITEDQFMRFNQQGQLENPDLTDRRYDRYGYLQHAYMTEQKGSSEVEYAYDSQHRLVRRTLTNREAGISYIHEYTYNEHGDIASQSQRVMEGTDECVMTINVRNNYLTRDQYGNWTSSSASLSYWEKGSQSQQVSVLQKRTIAYWE